ncbi:hypothetical protein F5148DRAFT_1196713 [Russula earlei]|uniref:Uncharacterized protein n=1 Tax=Russula earlei TaxID=71964 RepID=A0ACC0U9U0_9AGAM|nr:hypothetical protein F5148DRAFT_1196713 [Russula earlei]
MHTFSIFAIFCFASGIVPSLALPSGNPPNENRGRLSKKEFEKLMYQRKYLFKLKIHPAFPYFSLDDKRIVAAHEQSINERLLDHCKAVANERRKAEMGNHKNAR